ncbi:MAG: TlpA family protein disulfide reductase [Legionellaceae bacterium]|nr:TlpA family protein disulfide reductase [Legionellaceae bacterium]
MHIKKTSLRWATPSGLLRIGAALCFALCLQSSVAGPLLKLLDGKTVDFASLRGKWVLINYWATWCAPCLDEIADLNRFAREQAHKAQVFAVNFDGLPSAEQRRLSQQYQLAYPSLRDDPADSLNLGPIRGVPLTFVFNPQGQLVETLRGGQSYDNLRTAIRSRPE